MPPLRPARSWGGGSAVALFLLTGYLAATGASGTSPGTDVAGAPNRPVIRWQGP